MKKINRYQLFVLFTVLALTLTGCGSSATPVQTSEFTDGLGRTVTLTGTPQRIISLAPSNTEILFAVGASSQVVGRDEFSDYPDAAKSIPTIGGDMSKYSLEQIAALKPDLVLAAEINTEEQVKSIEDLGLTVYYLSNPTDLEGMYTNLETVGKLTGHSKEAESLVTSLQGRVAAVEKAIGSATPIKAYYELDGTDPSKPWVPAKGTFVDELMTMAGAENIAASAGEGWIQMSQEAIIAANPDVILLGDASYGITADTVSARPGWDQISAVKNGKIYPFDDNLVSRPGPRLVDGLEKLSAIFYE